MQTNFSKLPQSRAELIIELNQAEFRPYLEKAAIFLSESGKIPGFRPGKAPFDIVAKHFGEMRICEEAAEAAIPKLLEQVLTEKKIAAVGRPEINIEKLAPGNPFIFKAVVSLYPEIKLADWAKLKFQRKPRETTSAEVENVIEEARKMRASEVLVDRPAGSGDKIVIDLEISRDKVPVEGGAAKDHAVYLGEKHYIHGLPEELLGLKSGDVKEFSLSFSKTHYQKHLAGRKADFKVAVKGVFERKLPAIDDVFAQGLGQKTLAELRALIETNLRTEAEQKEERRLEAEILETIVKKSEFGELPAVLIGGEKHKMFEELKQNLAAMGVEMGDYLKNLKKTEKDLEADFDKGAGERVKSELVLREVAAGEKIEVSPEEFKEEKARLRELYKDSADIEKRLADPAVEDYIASMLVNRKTMKMLKEGVAE